MVARERSTLDGHPEVKQRRATRVLLASFPGPARSSLAVRNSRRGPGLVHHVMRAAGIILRHTRYSKIAVLQRY